MQIKGSVNTNIGTSPVGQSSWPARDFQSRGNAARTGTAPDTSTVHIGFRMVRDINEPRP